MALGGDTPWSEDDGPKGCSLMFVPVSPAEEAVLNGATIHEYPLTNEEIAEVSQSLDL